MQDKILFITLEYGNNIGGGAGRVINGLANCGMPIIPCSIFYMQFKLRWLGWKAFFYEYVDGTVQNTDRARKYKKMLLNIIAREKITIVHFIHSGAPSLRCLKVIRKKYPELKIVYSCHSIARYEAAIRKNSWWELIVEEKIIRNVDHIHILNKASLNYLVKSYPSISGQIPFSIIPNAVDEKSFKEYDARFKTDLSNRIGKATNLVVACMSRWSYGKGLEYLLDAIPEVIKYFPGIRFIITGKKTVSWENRFHKYLSLINKKIEPLKNYVIPLGWLNDKQRNTLFTLTDIWVMPSMLEYFPYSLLEPMAAGLPIISSRIDSALELLTEESDALFYEAGNSGQLAEKIVYLASRPGVRKILARNVREKVRHSYTWEMVVARYRKMYESIASGLQPGYANDSWEFTRRNV